MIQYPFVPAAFESVRGLSHVVRRSLSRGDYIERSGVIEVVVVPDDSSARTENNWGIT